MPTYTSQPDAANGIDNRIYEGSPDTNAGTANTIDVGLQTTKRRGLLKFNLAIGTNPPPAAAIVTSAVINLTCIAYYVTRTLAFYQCLRAWVELESTWNVYSTGNNWTTAGAGSDGNDYVSTELGSASVTGTGAVAITLNASGIAIVQGWVNGTIANNGFILRHTAETDDKNTYGSSDHATAESRPQFVIEYLLGGQFIRWSSE